METKVVWHPNQVLPSSELQAQEDFTQAALDRIVRELLFDEGRFVGLNVAKVDAFNITVGQGGYYKAGATYRQAQSQPISLVSLAPSTGSRVVLVVVSGETAQTRVQNVKFLVDATTRQTQQRPVATRETRQAKVELAASPASASPSRPSLPAGAIVVASLVLSSAGITDGPTMETANSVISLETAMAAIGVLEAARKSDKSLMQTLRSDIAALAKAITKKADLATMNDVQDGLLVIRERLDLPDTQSVSGIDDFASASETDETSTAVVEAGYAKFGAHERSSKLITLSNPNDSRLDISVSGLIIPKGRHELRFDAEDKTDELAIASYGVATQALKKQTFTRTYYWYEEIAPYAEVEAKLKLLAAVRVRNPKTDAFENLDLTKGDWRLIPRSYDRLPGGTPYWRIDVSTDTWSIDTTTVNVTGARIARSILCSQSGWHRMVEIEFTDVGATGDVHVAVCKVNEAGTPDRDRVVALVTTPVASLKKGWNEFKFDPFFLARGERYAVVLATTGNHKVALTAPNDANNGTLFVTTDGEYWQGMLDKDLRMRLYGQRFDASRVEIEIGDVTMGGGIRSLMAMFTGHQPEGTDLILQGRIDGVWRSIRETDPTILSTAPTQIPLKLIFLGTRDLMPGVDLSASRIVASRPRGSNVLLSTRQTMPSGVTATSIEVQFDTVAWDGAIHTLPVWICHGAGYATETAHASVRREKLSDGRHRHTYVVGGLPALSEFKIKADLGTTNDARTFSIDRRKHKRLA